MKILQPKPGIIHRCRSCNSSYEIEEGDLKIEVGQDPNNYWWASSMQPYEFLAYWSCPVCAEQEIERIDNSRFPKMWKNRLLKQNGWSGPWLTEYNKMKQAAFEIERLKLEATKITFSTPRNRKRGFWSRLFG